MKKNDLYERIEDYLNGKLSPLELGVFEQALKDDKDLAEVVTNRKKMRGETPKPVQRKRPFYTNLGAVVVVSLLCVLTLPILCKSPEPKKDEIEKHLKKSVGLANEYIKEEIKTANNIVGTGKIDVNKMKKSFQEGDYEGALLLIDDFLLKENPHDYEVLFMKSICLLELNKIQEARNTLNEYADDASIQNPELAIKAAFFKCITYIKTNEDKNAEEILKALVEENKTKQDYPYYKKAKRLLEAL